MKKEGIDFYLKELRRIKNLFRHSIPAKVVIKQLIAYGNNEKKREKLLVGVWSMNEKILRQICNKEPLKVIDFLSTNKFDWCVTDIARLSKVSRTVVYKLIKENVLIKTREGFYRLVGITDKAKNNRNN